MTTLYDLPSMVKRSAGLLILVLAFAALSAAAVNDPSPVIHSLLELTNPLGVGIALGDLDGDHQTDIALSRGVGRNGNGYLYRVELKLSQSERSDSFTFSHS